MLAKSLATFLLLGSMLMSYPAIALPLPNQILGSGDDTVVRGRARLYEGGLGTYIFINRPQGSVPTVAGFIPFGDRRSFPDLDYLDGRMVQIHGVVGLNGWPLITLTAPDQLREIG